MSNDNEQFNNWLKKASEGSLGKMKESGTYAGVVTKSFLEDPLCALQLGYAILLDKPIVLIADRNVDLPANLVRASKLIERVDIDNKDDMKRASESLANFVKGL